ncbi:DUF1566 domain-containing protein [Massilia norwichensis]|uniref:DUF1566 domain-containing protein n=1 Tax=Massilia norwichensis TaxID=1442366 RepID=A0ABT2AF91_9BURK|nr:DUF1566 domain-containing protein [Massilia norwichensis]MCS0592440.1 DUF1566 domain-containing protein [Massilia norwichensis]
MLKEGEAYAGLILGKDGETDYHLVLLPDDVSDVSWPTAREWAGSQEGDLPTRRELALLFANLRERFDRVWYWSNEQHDTRPQLVWGQNFASGIQTVYGRPFRGHARAVRRIGSS